MTDVLVAGAGFAGLAAARALVRAGKSVVVLEARDRVGGRTLSESHGGQLVDLGGQWMGDKHARLRTLADELGVASFPQFATGKKILERGDGKLRTFKGFMPPLGLFALIDLSRAISKLEKLAREVPLDAPMQAPDAAALDAQTFAAYLDDRVRTKRARAMLGMATEMIFAAQPHELSLLYVLHYAHAGDGFQRLCEIERGAQERRFTTGAQSIAGRLAAQLPDLRLEHAVLAVAQSAHDVTVHTTRGTLRAKRAILALPPALLATIDLGELSAARVALHTRMPMGSVIKCIAVYERAFWREAGYSGEAFSTTGLVRATFDDCSADGTHAALVAFVVGDRARELTKLPQEERRRLVLAELGRLHGPSAHRAIAYTDKDWLADPHAGGCYAGIMPPQLLTEAGTALRAPHGRVHFAGTETATRHVGYLEGALESAERVVAEVMVAAGADGTLVLGA